MTELIDKIEKDHCSFWENSSIFEV